MKQTDKPVATLPEFGSSQIDTSDWNIYRNNEFEFRYPPGINVKESSRQGRLSITIQGPPIDPGHPETKIYGIFHVRPRVDDESSRRLLGALRKNNPGVVFYNDLWSDPPHESYSFRTIYNDREFIISVDTLDEGYERIRKRQIELFESILGSLKFSRKTEEER